MSHAGFLAVDVVVDVDVDKVERDIAVLDISTMICLALPCLLFYPFISVPCGCDILYNFLLDVIEGRWIHDTLWLASSMPYCL